MEQRQRTDINRRERKGQSVTIQGERGKERGKTKKETTMRTSGSSRKEKNGERIHKYVARLRNHVRKVGWKARARRESKDRKWRSIRKGDVHIVWAGRRPYDLNRR